MSWTPFPTSGATGYNTTARAVIAELSTNGQTIETAVNSNTINIIGLVAGSGVLVSTKDQTIGYLYEDKLIAGTGISFSKNNPGGNETMTINATNYEENFGEIFFYQLVLSQNMIGG